MGAFPAQAGSASSPLPSCHHPSHLPPHLPSSSLFLPLPSPPLSCLPSFPACPLSISPPLSPHTLLHYHLHPHTHTACLPFLPRTPLIDPASLAACTGTNSISMRKRQAWRHMGFLPLSLHSLSYVASSMSRCLFACACPLATCLMNGVGGNGVCYAWSGRLGRRKVGGEWWEVEASVV